ncbi:MAG: hypothetical protein KME06_09600 [Kastovskya adunca ATA6-11-RM4]|nr:hypothetical protein [Kastovskya adunca ATA6-11-RM4]
MSLVSAAVYPYVQEVEAGEKLSASMTVGLIVAVSSAIGNAIGRLNANDTVVYTPPGVLGLNRSNAKQKARIQSAPLNQSNFPKAVDEEFWEEEY